jgi:hypothetical protein
VNYKGDVMECEGYRDQMLDVLYGEADAESARLVEMHQGACEACREEMASLRHVRHDLRAWTLPALPARRPGAPASRVRPLLAMAAGLVLTAGAALGLSGSEVSYREGRLAFRLGRGPAAPDVTSMQAKLEGLEAELQALKSRPAATPVLLSAPAAPPTDLMAAVDRKIQESEKRMAAAYNADFADFKAVQAARLERQFTAIKAYLAYEFGRNALRQASYTSDASLAR